MAAIMIIALIVTVSSGRSQSARGPVVPPPKDFAEFLVARDLVVIGTVVDAQDLVRKPLESCGVVGLSPMRVTDVRISVEIVKYGTADDSILQISVLGQRGFQGGRLSAGGRVLAWAFRDCDDGWRLWGDLCVVTPDGNVIGRDGEGEYVRLDGQPAGAPVTLGSLDSALANRALLHATNAFEGTSSIALERLIATTRRADGGFTYECENLGWVLGQGQSVPRYVDFPLVADCYPMIFPGDTLLVPLPAGFSAERLRLDSCPRALKVQHGFVPGLGVRLSFLSYVLGAQGNTFHVRSFVRRGQ